jgi:hypothetical protein
MTDTATEPGLNLLPAVTSGGNPKLKGGVNPPDKAQDPTAAERQRRYRQRKSLTDRRDCDADRNEDRNGERNDDRYGRRNTMLCAPQDAITIIFDDDGNATLRQERWPDEDVEISIHRDNLDTFIDKLTDAFGIPTFGRP